jgi:enolase
MVDFWINWINQYPIVSIEDGWPRTTGRLEADDPKVGKKIQIVGDDLLVTNPERVRRAIKKTPATPCWSN